jgi:hypothetical protein
MTYPTKTDAFEAYMQKLATTFPGLCTVTAFPKQTNSVSMPPRTYSFMKIGNGSGAGRPAMLAVAGHHAREWAPPDATLTFALKLLTAYKANTPFTIPALRDAAGTHGPVVVSAATVKTIVDSMDLYLVPLANPDGRAFTEAATANMKWRKNRAPLPIPLDPANVGVDLNRNYDIAWDFDVFFTPAAAADPDFLHSTSNDPSTETYHGSALRGTVAPTFAENETLNIAWLFTTYPAITWFADLHSYSQLVMHPWGIEKLGTDNPPPVTPGMPAVPTSPADQNFQNAAKNGLRDGALGNTYHEFFPNGVPLTLLQDHRTMCKSITDNISAATGAAYNALGAVAGGVRQYQDASAADIYGCPVTGLSSDYAFKLQFMTAGAPAMYSFAIEFGDSVENFQPTVARYPKVESEVHAALLRLAQYISVWLGWINTLKSVPGP